MGVKAMGRMKKLLMITVCAVLLFGMTAQAEGTTEFHVENQSGKAGDIVNVPVEFNTGQEVGGFQISVYYDSEMMEFQSLEKGNLIIEEGQGIFDYNHIPESSEIVVVYVVADTVKDEGVIVDLQFKLKKDCGEQLPIGVGIDQMVDNTEEDAPITGVVSGVDETFQAKVMEQTGGNTVTAGEAGAAQTGKAEDAAENAGDVQTQDTEDKDAVDGSAVDTQSAESGNDAGSGTDDAAGLDNETGAGIGAIQIVLIVVIVAAVAAVGGATFYIVRKKGKR